jgi:acyl-coenzyme A synthetase/AMP-(fatty) acid ligase
VLFLWQRDKDGVTLRLVGRSDRQVKVQGRRADAREIEAAIKVR